MGWSVIIIKPYKVFLLTRIGTNLFEFSRTMAAGTIDTTLHE
jgi:hypothetical protein